MTLQDNVIKGSSDFTEGSSSLNVNPARFGGHGHCGSGDNVFNPLSASDFVRNYQ